MDHTPRSLLGNKQFDSTVAIGKGLDAAKSICLKGGQVTVTGRYELDSWNGYQLTIVGINGTVFLPPWSGPASGTGEATTSFLFGCPPGTFGNKCTNTCPTGRWYLDAWTTTTSMTNACPFTLGACPMRYYCPGPKGLASPCPLGKYGNETGLTVCKSCLLGTTTLTLGSKECIICPKGAYCPNAAPGHLCPLGKYGNETGLTGPSACKSCLLGTIALSSDQRRYHMPERRILSERYIKAILSFGKIWKRNGTDGAVCVQALPTRNHCYVCRIDRGVQYARKGAYCSNATSKQSCPMGKYSNETEQTLSNACMDCPMGTIALLKGMSNCANALQEVIAQNTTSKQLCSQESTALFMVP